MTQMIRARQVVVRLRRVDRVPRDHALEFPHRATGIPGIEQQVAEQLMQSVGFRVNVIKNELI